MNNYSDHLENLNYYFDLEMRENNLTNIQSTNIFNLVMEELNFLYLQRYPSPPSGGTCLQEWQNDMQDCRDDALMGSVSSVAAAGAGIIPGLIGAGLTMWAFSTCKKRAQRDYELCLS